MKNIKRFLIVLVLSLTIFLYGCDQDNGQTKGGSATGSSDIEITDPDFAFVKAEEYDPTTFDVSKAARWTSLDVDSDYYLFLSFQVKSRRDNDGQSLLDVNFTFDALNIMEGTMEDAATGMIEEMTFTDAQTGNIGKKTTVSFKIPSLSNEPKNINVIVSLRPVTVGESHIIIGYNYNTSEQYHILGSDGYTKNLRIKAVQIDPPTVTVTELGSLKWTHVKNADYYCIYYAGHSDPITDYEGNVIKVSSEGVKVGGELIYNIGEFVYGYNTLIIRAFSNNPNILSSNYSNSVEYVW